MVAIGGIAIAGRCLAEKCIVRVGSSQQKESPAGRMKPCHSSAFCPKQKHYSSTRQCENGTAVALRHISLGLFDMEIQIQGSEVKILTLPILKDFGEARRIKGITADPVRSPQLRE